ncbi:protein dopey-2 [Polypterus senegalus]
MTKMDPEELELLNDYRYRNYASVIEKALRNFESSSEWADLISSLGKLNKALQSNLKYSLLPKRLIIGKRLAQCLHPALPSGVHLKALETYEVIFKIIGTKWLAKDLFIYSAGLFPLLGHAAMSVKPALLALYEKYYLPLQTCLLPSLQAFITGLLPGLEEGSEVNERSHVLLQKLSLVVGQNVFYTALWGSVLINPQIRLPASLFVVSHIEKAVPGKKQNYLLGTDYKLTIKALCSAVQDSNVLVQRNILETILFFFPFYTCMNYEEGCIPLSRDEMVDIVSAATLTVLRRDMSLNRRLYAWFLGTDIKGGIVAPDPSVSTTLEDHSVFYFDTYSRKFLIQALINIMKQQVVETESETGPHTYLKPFRIMISLLDKPEIGPQITGDLLLEFIRAFYAYCKDILGDDFLLASSHSGSYISSKIKENKTASEIIKTVNLLIASLSTEYLWDYMSRCFESSVRMSSSRDSGASEFIVLNPSVSELSTLIIFLLDVIPLELYSEIQTQYLPQMLNNMLHCILEHIDELSLPELTNGLKACFKVLNKIQMPVAYMDLELDSERHIEQELTVVKESLRAVVQKVEEEAIKENENDIGDVELIPDSPYLPLRSEDSGIGLSASPSQHFQLGSNNSVTGGGICPESDNVWRKGGSVESMTQCTQKILAAFINRYLLSPAEEDKKQFDIGGRNKKTATAKKGWDTKQIAMQKLTDFFTIGKPMQFILTDEKKGTSADREWSSQNELCDRRDVSEESRQAFSAACQLMLECSTFPVYLSEEETDSLYTSVFQETGNGEAGLPVWLKSLMALCCYIMDYHIQNVAISTLLELVNHSQSLALVIEDKKNRYKDSENNPFYGRLQMVTIPPIGSGDLKVIAEKTDFYQRVAHVLWNELNVENREHHITSVELFYKLHCLAPMASICEDIICLALLHRDKAYRIEALFRFSVLWHLTREIQGNRTTSRNRSFDRSLFVVLESLNCQDGAISATAQGWLVRAFSLNDVVRILEPVLLLLLHPGTQRSSIQCVKQNLTVGNLKILNSKHETFYKKLESPCDDDSSLSEDSILIRMTTVDREALWTEVESIPETINIGTPLQQRKCTARSQMEKNEENEEESEHTESADTSMGHPSSDNTSSASAPYLQHPLSESSVDEEDGSSKVFLKRTVNEISPVYRADSEKTQASESFSSDEEDTELEAMARAKLLKQQKEKREMINSMFKHVLLYFEPYDSKKVLYAFSVLESVLKTNPKEFVEAISTTALDTSSTAHLNLIYNLLARHQEALLGRNFYGQLEAQSPVSYPYSLLIELFTYLCLSFLRSYYPCYLVIGHKDLLGNRDVQVKSVGVLIRLMRQLVSVAKSQDVKNQDLIRNLLSHCEVQEYVLLSLSASMYINQKGVTHERNNDLLEDGLSEESLINFGQDQIWSEHPLQIELLKLLQVLIVLEYHLGGSCAEEKDGSSPLSREWQSILQFQQSINALQYVKSHPITSQGIFVSAVMRALQPQYGYGMHPPWVSLVTSSLPYLGKSLGMTVAPFISQICKNLDDLVKQYQNEYLNLSSSSGRKENIAPDYPLTLLEGLTTITHFCLLENASLQRKPSSKIDPASLRNARNSIMEELPKIMNSMSLLWGVIRKEESQKKLTDISLGINKGSSSSVYFKTTKILRQKILDFLNPLAVQHGLALMASVATVWNNRGSRKNRNKSKILLAPSESQLTIVELMKSLSSLRMDSILQLIREVVKKPAQMKLEQKSSSLVDIPVLQFGYAFVQSISATALQDNFSSVISLLKESMQLNLVPPGYFLLFGILNDVVTRLSNLDSKKDQKDLQDVTQKVLELLGNVVGSSLEQTSWLSRNLEVKAQPQVTMDEEHDPDADLYDSAVQVPAVVSSSVPSIYSIQALTLLAEILAPLLDMVYRSDEKEKAVPLISRLLYYVFPYLKNHCAHNILSFRASAQLLSSLSGYAYTKRAWKKEVFELFVDPQFFQMDVSCVSHWRSIIDHLLTHEKTMFKDIMSMNSSSLKMVANNEQKAMLLKRQAFAIYSGELDQYHLFLPLIQERLTESLRGSQTSLVSAQMFLAFRVLVLRISPQHLTSLWPIMVTELIQVFIQLEERLDEEDSLRNYKNVNNQKNRVVNGHLLSFAQNELYLYLSACKFLDTALSFPPDRMPLFQMYRWAFVPEVDTEMHKNVANDAVVVYQECKPHITRILERLNRLYGEQNGIGEVNCSTLWEFPLLSLQHISNITQLIPFFRILNCTFMTGHEQRQKDDSQPVCAVSYPASNSEAVLKKLEDGVEQEFLESLDA